MKICPKCGSEKELSEFQVRNASKDGLTASCCDCLKAYDKGRATSKSRVEGRKAYLLTDKGRQVRKETNCRYIEKNKKKRKAHVAVGNAVRSGRLLKSCICEYCLESKPIEGHHSDYNKPLEVLWLCSKCHADWHKNNEYVA